MTDLLATSPDTWRERDLDPPVVPAELRPPVGATPRQRNAAFWQRHELRRQRAEDVYAASRNPERGWPVSGNRAVFAFFRDLLTSRRRMFVTLVVLNALAAATGLAVPRLLGELVNTTVDGDGGLSLNTLALIIIAVVLAQAGFTFVAQRTSTFFGQDLLSTAREYIVRTILRLPLGAVEGASTGDLVTRVTRDVGTMSRSVQYGVPMAIISLLTVVLSVVAMLLNSVILAVPALLTFATSAWAVRGYLGRAPKAYITEGATYSRINTTLTETVEGARTLEALGLSGVRVGAGNDDIEVSAQAERYTMSLRNILFIALNFAFGTPRVVTLLVGAYAYSRGWVDLGQITAAALYVEALSDPLDRLISEVDRLQVGAASTSRLLGIAEVKPDRTPGDPCPTASTWSPTTCASPTGRATTSSTASTCGSGRASGWPSSDRAAPASRPWAACSRASTVLAPGRPPSVGSSSSTCRSRCCAPRWRWSPRSTTSSSARCATTSCWPARTPTTTPSARR